MAFRTPLTPFALAAGLLVLGLGCNEPKLTPDQLQALRQAQTRNYEAGLDTVFKATMSYLQDNHYQIKNANKENGIINAVRSQDLSTGSKVWGAFWWGAGAKKGDHYDITFTFDAIDAGNTRLRCNITHGESNLAGNSRDEQAVTDPALYKGLLDGLTVEVQRRKMTEDMRQSQPAPATPAPSATPAPVPAPAPDAAPASNLPAA